nr:integrator complex subunit 14-like [Lepeophtheirus salmonis]
MPTVIILDTSLSMLRPISEKDLSTTYMDLAIGGISMILDHLEQHFKLEYVALLLHSSLSDVLVGFTRDLNVIRDKLSSIDAFDTSRIPSAITGLCSLISEEWGPCLPIDSILITDGTLNHNQSPFQKSPLALKGSFNVISLCPMPQHVQDHFENIIQTLNIPGRVYLTQYQPYIGTLKFGHSLSCTVSLCPPPRSPYKVTGDFTSYTSTLGNSLDILGFLTLSDVASPPVISKHLVITTTELGEDSRNVPSLVVFLHGAFKVVNMCALVKVSEEDDWYGLLFSCSDSKKRSSLMLSLFEPGSKPVPWLGDIQELGPSSDLNETTFDPFPVPRRGMKPSYSSNPVVWIKNSSLQSDIQKILRHGRKLPDKTPHFYKELNRLKKAALCLGFHELLEGVAAIFERECSVLPASSHPDCAVQLRHAAEELRSKECLSLEHQITPLNQKFK